MATKEPIVVVESVPEPIVTEPTTITDPQVPEKEEPNAKVEKTKKTKESKPKKASKQRNPASHPTYEEVRFNSFNCFLILCVLF